MDTLFSKLASCLEGPLELILCLGAGSSVELSEYAALNPGRLVFVEGDPDAAERLAQSLAGEAACQVWPVLVTPNGASVPFYRYNLPLLNGPLPIGGLQTLYPRLKVDEELALSSKTLSTLLETIPAAGAGARLLMIDLPGQEAAILGSVHPDHLRAFEWILVRGCSKALQAAAQPMEASIVRLEELLFERVALDEESDPAWPVVLLHFDRRMAEFVQELESRTRLLIEKVAENERQAKRIAELEAQLGSSQPELELARQQLAELSQRMREAADREMAAAAERDNRTAQLGSANERLAPLETELASQKMLVEVLSKGRAQQDRLYHEISRQRDGLRGEIEALTRRIIEMEGLLSSKETRGRLVDAEFQKVEGQIDLIKEIFLRENT